MKLHYSQTTDTSASPNTSFSTLWNYTTLKPDYLTIDRIDSLVPYEITLLSNRYILFNFSFTSLVPYEITLLSNRIATDVVILHRLVPYEITLLSNLFRHQGIGIIV